MWSPILYNIIILCLEAGSHPVINIIVHNCISFGKTKKSHHLNQCSPRDSYVFNGRHFLMPTTKTGNSRAVLGESRAEWGGIGAESAF